MNFQIEYFSDFCANLFKLDLCPVINIDVEVDRDGMVTSMYIYSNVLNAEVNGAIDLELLYNESNFKFEVDKNIDLNVSQMHRCDETVGAS